MEILNRQAYYNYFVLETYEAGIVLTGTEIKSIRAGKCNIKDSYAIVKNDEVFLLNTHISPYDKGNQFNHEETRTRELLLHKNQILKLYNKVKLERLAIVALKAYFVGSLVKIEIALGKGKKLADKRETIKERDEKRHIEKSIKNIYK